MLTPLLRLTLAMSDKAKANKLGSKSAGAHSAKNPSGEPGKCSPSFCCCWGFVCCSALPSPQRSLVIQTNECGASAEQCASKESKEREKERREKTGSNERLTQMPCELTDKGDRSSGHLYILIRSSRVL